MLEADFIKKKYEIAKQEHIFRFWDELNDDEKIELLHQAMTINLDEIESSLIPLLVVEKKRIIDYETLEPPVVFRPTDEDKTFGKKMLAENKICFLLVAGGQGTRLGFDGPKGMYPVGPVSSKTLFQIHAEKIIKYQDRMDPAISLLTP